MCTTNVYYQLKKNLNIEIEFVIVMDLNMFVSKVCLSVSLLQKVKKEWSPAHKWGLSSQPPSQSFLPSHTFYSGYVLFLWMFTVLELPENKLFYGECVYLWENAFVSKKT